LLGGGGVKLAGAGGKVALGSKVHPFPVGGQANGVVDGLYAFALVPTGLAFNHWLFKLSNSGCIGVGAPLVPSGYTIRP